MSPSTLGARARPGDDPREDGGDRAADGAQTTAAYLADAPGGPLRRGAIGRRAPRADDVTVRIDFCGVCHSDLHALSDGSGSTPFPLVPGHEFTGEVVAVGEAVERFAPGDRVAVGNIVDSCGECRMCRAGQENYCERTPTLTYGGLDRVDGTTTQGGYSRSTVVRDRFVYHLPQGLDSTRAAPLMCAGVTVWEPLVRWGVGPGTALGVVGLGGLGHLAVKLGHALGARVTVFTTSQKKTGDAVSLGADEVVISSDQEAMERARDTMDLVIDTVSAPHDLRPYLNVVALDGTLVTLGSLGPISVHTMDLLVGRKSLASAGSGGTPGTQQLLDFCAAHAIEAEVEVLPSARVHDAIERLRRNDVYYRFVIDLSDLDTPQVSR